MAGLKLYAGGMGGTDSAVAAQYGGAQSYNSGLSMSASSAAFNGPMTTPTLSTQDMLTPVHGFGIAVWMGAVAIGALYLLRRSLPN